MRAVVQRVDSANVKVDGSIVGSINKGLLVFLGVGQEDEEKDLNYVVDKLVNLRIFQDSCDKMNLSLIDIRGELLLVSQFTLYGDVRKGKRPSFTSSASPEKGREYYEKFISKSREYGLKVATGSFGAHMNVSLENNGPVTILIDSKKEF